MARQAPRATRYGRLLVALLVYLVYLNCLLIGRSGLESGWVPALLGLWWVHLPILAIGLGLYWNQQRPYRRLRA
jgi:lipopolysaccharide export system permease protein